MERGRRRARRAAAAALIWALAAGMLAGCGRGEVSREVFAMDTVMELRLWGGAGADLDAAEAVLARMEAELSVTAPESAISALNRTGAGQVSGETAQLLTQALALCERTGGALDVTVYPVVRSWGFTTGEYRRPRPEELAELLKKVDYRKVTVAEDGQVRLEEGMELDLGSVAKGWAGRALRALLLERGVNSALLDLGGNIQTVGTRPDGRPWRVAVRDPLGEGTIGVVEAVDQAVVTSGGYRRKFQLEGETYWHIMDPATGAPARSGLASVTVVGEDGLVCDGLSTGLFVLGLEEGARLWQESGDFEAVFVTWEGEIYLTQGLEGSFRPAEGVEYTLLRREGA